ncbi:MAG: hypothetical protein ABEI13_03330, partial [Candidatus Paceibacteria bacterium]
MTFNNIVKSPDNPITGGTGTPPKSYQWENLSANTEYWPRVRVQDSQNNWSDWSEGESFTSESAPTPAPNPEPTISSPGSCSTGVGPKISNPATTGSAPSPSTSGLSECETGTQTINTNNSSISSYISSQYSEKYDWSVLNETTVTESVSYTYTVTEQVGEDCEEVCTTDEDGNETCTEE